MTCLFSSCICILSEFTSGVKDVTFVLTKYDLQLYVENGLVDRSNLRVVLLCFYKA